MLKSKIKKILQYYPKFNETKIINEINKYEYVSFDVFDTLIKRDVENPYDVFKIISDKINKKEFYTDRINAEKKARIITNKEEIRLEEIYSILEKEYKYVGKDLEEFCNLEIELEKSLTTKNIEMYKIYEYCLKKGKKIIITSNMYLPKKIIESILKKSGYDKYEKIYVSSDIGKKKNKTLFGFILNDLGISSKQIIHIGDSFKNDYVGPKKYCIKSILIPTKYYKIRVVKEMDKYDNDYNFNKMLDNFINNRIYSSNDNYYNFGYSNFGILLYGFNKFLHDSLKEKGISDVFFFSRDGYIIKKIYDIMYPNDDIKSHYIYVSRRSLRVPKIWMNPELKSVITTFPSTKLLTMETFILNLGLNPNKYVNTLNNYDLKLDTYILKKDILSTPQILNFYKEIVDDVVENSKKEYEILSKYFHQEAFYGKVGVVDIGWRGSLQYFINGMFNNDKSHDLNMEGYYIGISSDHKDVISIKGYLRDNDKSIYCDNWKSFNGLFETLFLAQEGSTEKFVLNGNQVRPKLLKYEYDDSRGRFINEAKKVELIQNGAIDFVNDFKNSILSTYDFTNQTAYKRIYMVGTKPTKNDIQMFGDFRFFEEQIDYLARPQKLIKYVFHLKKLKHDLFLSRWKIGFMKKILKFNLPYKKIYEFMQKISN